MTRKRPLTRTHLSDIPRHHGLIPTNLRCTACSAPACVALPEDESIRHALERTSCPSCGAAKRMRLDPVFPSDPSPEIVERDEPPDELGDEELFEQRAKIRAWPRRTE